MSGQPVKRGTMAHQHIVYMMLAEAAARLDDVSALQRYAKKLEDLAIKDDHQPYLAIANRAWGIVCRFEGQYVDAKERLEKALSLFEQRNARWQIGRTLFEFAQLNLDQANLAGAQEYFSRALAEFESLGAMPDMKKTKSAIEAIT